MGEVGRFDFLIERHIGIGIRWSRDWYWLDLSLSVMCFTFTAGIGRKHT